MALDIGTAVAYLKLDLTAFNLAIDSATNVVEGFVDTVQGNVDSLGDIFTNVGVGAEVLGNSLTQSLTVPLVNFGQSAIDAYRDYESAFTGIKKTLGVTDNAMEAFGGDMDKIYASIDEAIQGLAGSTASSAEDIAAVMEAAGQLGIQFDENGKGLVEFTEVMVKLGDTTNLSADEAATALAKFMNVTGTAMEDVDRLGSVIVDLGNNFATDEASIVRMSTRLASAGSIAGLTERDILALSTAMSSVGINAEAGGSSMSQTLAQIEKAVQMALGGDEGAIDMVETLGRVSGMSAAEFSQAWLNDPMTALTQFLLGMGKLDEQGESAVLILDELGMTGIRQSNMLKALGLAGGVLSDAIQTSNKAWDENIALSNEAELRYGTLDSQMSRLNEEWKAMQRDIAELLLPILQDLVGMLRDLIDWWNGLSDGTKEALVQIGEIAVVVGPALMFFGKLFSAIGLVVGMFEKITAITPVVAQGLGLVGGGIIEMSGSIMGVIGPVVSIIGGAAAAVIAFLDMLQNGCNLVNELLLAVGLGLVAFSATLLGVTWPVAAIGAVVVFVIANIIANWDKLVDLVKKGWELFKEIFGMLIEGIKDIAVKFAEWVVEITAKLWEFITDILKNVAKFIADVTKAVFDFFADILKKTAKWIADIIKAVVEFLANIIKNTVKFIADVTKKAVELFANIIKKVVEFISNVVKNVIEFFADIIKNIAEFVSNVIKAVGDFFLDIAKRVIEFFADIAKNVIDFFSGNIKDFGEFVSNIVKSVSDFFSDIFMRFVGFIEDIIASLGTFFGNLITGFANFVSDIFQHLWNFAGSVFKWVGESLGNIWNSIVGWFGDLFGWFKDLPGKFFDIGAKIFGGLWDGLKSIWDKLTGWISDGVKWLAEKVDKIFPGFSSGNMFGFGSHAAGLDYVPFDGYMAQLHEGERVLTKQEARDYNRGETNGSGGDTFNFYNTKPDPYEYARQMRRAKREEAFG